MKSKSIEDITDQRDSLEDSLLRVWYPKLYKAVALELPKKAEILKRIEEKEHLLFLSNQELVKRKNFQKEERFKEMQALLIQHIRDTKWSKRVESLYKKFERVCLFSEKGKFFEYGEEDQSGHVDIFREKENSLFTLEFQFNDWDAREFKIKFLMDGTLNGFLTSIKIVEATSKMYQSLGGHSSKREVPFDPKLLITDIFNSFQKGVLNKRL